MKRAAFLILALSPLPVFAEASQQEICRVVGDMAESVMIQRQAGAKMSDMLRIYGEDLAEVPEAVDHITKLTLLAFEKPLFSTDEAKNRSIIEFRNQAELGCYKS